MTQTAVRRTPDVLQEFYAYRDTGCEIAPSCLQCPLPQCKYDNPRLARREKRSERDRQVVTAFRHGGMSALQVAALFGMSQRTVFRIIKRYDEEMIEMTEMNEMPVAA